MTHVSISAQTLIELGALRSRAGATILGAAVIDDVMGAGMISRGEVGLIVAGRSTGSDAVLEETIGHVPETIEASP